MSRSIAIVGAGIAGLAAGCYGQMNGYATEIYELHDRPGGLCTSWNRQGYTFDGCIHWLVGTAAGSSVNHIWQELGALQGRPVVDHDEFMRVEGGNGQVLIIYTNLDRLEQHMRELSPVDGDLVGEFCRAARRCARFGQAMGAAATGLSGRLKMVAALLSTMPTLNRYGRLPVSTFAARFHDPFLRQALASTFDMPDFPVAAMLMTLAWMNSRDAGYPVGGSLAFARAIEHRYLDLGGQIHYRSRVGQVLVENDRAVGVRLADGSEHRADVVISCADGHATIWDMLGGKYLDDTVRGYYERLPIFQPIVQVSLGVARDLSDQPHTILLQLAEPLTIAGELHKHMSIRHFCYDPTMAPPGKSAITSFFPSSYARWQALAQDRTRYEAEKAQIASDVIARLEQRFPGIARQVEVVDVATPLTYERYTGNWQGSMEGWLITTQTMRMQFGRGMEKTLPGLDSFYMAGQWVEPGGGVPTAAMSARRVLEMICRHDRQRFVAQTPSY
jgi:phytoene dehydrogenase-like protein